jgi:DNA-binding transcriptional LysR family regulator
MNYTLNQLRIFLCVAQLKSITRAAEELHLTQPAVSIQLKKFQEQFDWPLIEMVHKRVHVTEFGREIMASAERILAEVNALHTVLHAYRGELTGTLKLSVVSTGKYIAPHFLSAFVKRHPGVNVVLDVTNKSRVVESLEGVAADFALLSVFPEHLQLESEPLMENQLYLVGHPDAPWLDPALTQEWITQLPMIFREPGSGTRAVTERFLKHLSVKPRISIEFTSNEAVKQAVMADLGYSIMPLIGLKNELKERELKIIPAQGFPLTSMWHLVWLKQRTLSPVAQAFLNFIRNEKSSIMDAKFEWYRDFKG